MSNIIFDNLTIWNFPIGEDHFWIWFRVQKWSFLCFYPMRRAPSTKSSTSPCLFSFQSRSFWYIFLLRTISFTPFWDLLKIIVNKYCTIWWRNLFLFVAILEYIRTPSLPKHILFISYHNSASFPKDRIADDLDGTGDRQFYMMSAWAKGIALNLFHSVGNLISDFMEGVKATY